MDERESKFQKAVAKIDIFIDANDGYTRQGVDQPRQGNTNYVVFAKRSGDLVVFKEFCTEERKERECFAMRHWQSTGLVPEIIWADDPTLVVMSYVPGRFIGRGGVSGDELVSECFEAGKAFGVFPTVLWTDEDQTFLHSPTCGAWDEFEPDFDRVMGLGWDKQERLSEFSGSFWNESLKFVATHRDIILSQPRFLCHQDAIHFHIHNGKFVKFFDLEMCFSGGEATQLGFLFYWLVNVWKRNNDCWPAFCEGWEHSTRKKLNREDLEAAVALHEWRCWDEVTNIDDPEEDRYKMRIKDVREMVLGERA